MTVTVSKFRTDFSEFSDTTAYPDQDVNFWLLVAVGDPAATPPVNGLLNERRLRSQYDLVTELFLAHNLSLEAKAKAEASNGAAPGVTTGPVSAKSVDKVSVSYDTGGGLELDAGHWNLTIYGTRFIRLVRLFGMGPIQIGVGATPWLAGPGWPGPFPSGGY